MCFLSHPLSLSHSSNCLFRLQINNPNKKLRQILKNWMTLSDSQKLEVLEFFSLKGLNIKIMNKSFCPTSVSFKHPAAYIQGSDISSKNIAGLNDENQLPACTNLHECLHYQSGISCTPVAFFLMWTIKNYKWAVFIAFPPGSQLRALQAVLRRIQGALLVSQCVLTSP